MMIKKTLIVFAAFLLSIILNAQNTLPSCVITTPHCNAYFEQGKDLIIKVYASDLGGTFTEGSVSKVEFFKDDIKLGESVISSANTYSFVWTEVPAGTY